MLDLLLGNDKPDGYALFKRTHEKSLTDERSLRRAVHESMLIGTTQQRVVPKLQAMPPLAWSDAELGKTKPAGYELIIGLDPKVHDGRFANNGWLQELPETFTKLSWDNAVLVPFHVANELGLEDGVLVDLKIGDKTIRLPAIVAPGQAPGVLKVTLGYGRSHAGHVGGLESESIASVGGQRLRLRHHGRRLPAFRRLDHPRRRRRALGDHSRSARDRSDRRGGRAGTPGSAGARGHDRASTARSRNS